MADVLILPNIGKAVGFFTSAVWLDELCVWDLQHSRHHKLKPSHCRYWQYAQTHTHTHLTALCPRLPRSAGTRKGKTNLDFTEARDSEWQWHQLGHMQVCTSLQADNHASTPPFSFLQAGCPSCRPTDSVKALKATSMFLCSMHRNKNKCNSEHCYFSCSSREGGVVRPVCLYECQRISITS